MLLSKMKWPEVKQALAEQRIVIVPVGSTEQHGPHLPVDVDVDCPLYIATKAAERTGDIVAPPVNYGYNEKEWMFPGTVSVSHDSFQHFVFDICNSLARSGFQRIFILNGHGWNRMAVGAVTHLVNEKTDAWCASASWWQMATDTIMQVRESPVPGGMAHAGEAETSAMLYINPEYVDMSKSVREISFPQTRYTWLDLIQAPPVFITSRFDRYTTSGVVGDATLGTREKGEKMIEAAVEAVADFLVQFKATYKIDSSGQ